MAQLVFTSCIGIPVTKCNYISNLPLIIQLAFHLPFRDLPVGGVHPPIPPWIHQCLMPFCWLLLLDYNASSCFYFSEIPPVQHCIIGLCNFLGVQRKKLPVQIMQLPVHWTDGRVAS